MDLHTALVTIIAVCAILAFQFTVFAAALALGLRPIKETLARHDEELKDLKAGQAGLEDRQIKLEGDIRDLKVGQAKLEGRLDKVEGRLDKLERRLDKLGGRFDNLEALLREALAARA